MRLIRNTQLALAGLLLTVATTFAIAGGRGAATAESVSTRSVSADEAKTLQYMREEEKMARDVYLTLYGVYGEKVFANIMDAEQTHFDAVGSLLDKYGVRDPAAQDIHGVFENPDLQALYYQLIAEGERGLVNALYVGGLIEETDMGDLAAAIDESSHRDIDRVYTNLRDGSKNHLGAFVFALESQGISYEPQVLTESEVESILEESASHASSTPD